MKKVITIIFFNIGVDCLGFPQYHTHELIEWIKPESKHFNPYSK